LQHETQQNHEGEEKVKATPREAPRATLRETPRETPKETRRI
jgi:hypothetical protein